MAKEDEDAVTIIYGDAVAIPREGAAPDKTLALHATMRFIPPNSLYDSIDGRIDCFSATRAKVDACMLANYTSRPAGS